MWQLLNNLYTMIRDRHQSQRSSALPAGKCSLFSGILTNPHICRQLFVEGEKHLISCFAPSYKHQESTCLLITIFLPNEKKKYHSFKNINVEWYLPASSITMISSTWDTLAKVFKCLLRQLSLIWWGKTMTSFHSICLILTCLPISNRVYEDQQTSPNCTVIHLSIRWLQKKLPPTI